MDTNQVIAVAVSAVLVAIFSTFHYWPEMTMGKLTLWRELDWESEHYDSIPWSALSLIAGILGVAATGWVGLGLPQVDTPLQSATAGLLAGILTVLFIHSLCTDLKTRLVDRRPVQLGICLSIIPAIAYCVSQGDYIILGASALLLMFAAFLYIVFINAIGAGDARALMLLAVTATPVLGVAGFAWGGIFAAAMFLLYGFGVSAWKRSSKVSTAAVPLLLFPFWLVLVLTPVVNFSVEFLTNSPAA